MVYLTDGFITDSVHVIADNAIAGYEPAGLDFRRHLVLHVGCSYSCSNSAGVRTFGPAGYGERPPAFAFFERAFVVSHCRINLRRVLGTPVKARQRYLKQFSLLE